MLRLTLILLFCSTLTLVFSQSQRAEQLRKNVVAISARGEKGFGFITGERNGELFIVTAAHVVEKRLSRQAAGRVEIF
jgi:sulfatase modifying factor 1